MGALLSSDVYQYKVDSHLESIQNCMAIADDIIIFGFRDDGKDHDVMVRQVLDKAKAVGMRFNPSKCQFRKTSVKVFWPCTVMKWSVTRSCKNSSIEITA